MLELNLTLRGFEAEPQVVAAALDRTPDRIANVGERVNAVTSAVFKKNALVYVFHPFEGEDIGDLLGRSIDSIGSWTRLLNAKNEFRIEFIEIDLILRTDADPLNSSYFFTKEFIRNICRVGGTIGISIDTTRR